MNPIFLLLQKLPTNGWTTAIGGLGLLLYGLGGLITGKLDGPTAGMAISAGITALGLGSKLDKLKKSLLPPA